MKVYKIFAGIIFIAIASLVLTTGCEYDVTPTQWDENKDKPLPPSPTITQVTPAVATAGVNTITIQGTGFIGSKAIDHVFFDNTAVDTVDIVSISTTEITVRRPNLISDTCTIKVKSDSAGETVKFKPYKIDPVTQRYGGFNANVLLSVATIDNAENMYVIDAVNQNRIYKVSSDGSNSFDTTQSALPRFPRDVVVGPDGRLYLVGNGAAQGHANINVVDVSVHPHQWSVWRTITGKSVRFGDFDANGYFYTGGGRTDLMIIAPDSSNRASGMYLTGASGDSIFAVKVFNSYLYVAAKLGTGDKGVWRHTIGAAGTLGARELYVDFRSDTIFAGRTIRNIMMSAGGTMYIGTDSPNPLLVVDPTTKKIDYFYKNILFAYAKSSFWGNGNYAYMMSGNSVPAQEWTFYRVNMGAAGAAK